VRLTLDAHGRLHAYEALLASPFAATPLVFQAASAGTKRVPSDLKYRPYWDRRPQQSFDISDILRFIGLQPDDDLPAIVIADR